MKMVLRQRKNKLQELVKDLDIFVKLDEHYVEQTLSGAVGKIHICLILVGRSKVLFSTLVEYFYFFK